jgi:hypothetical protein
MSDTTASLRRKIGSAEDLQRKNTTIEADLEILQRKSFNYFVHESNPVNGLVIDKTAPDWPASIAATGFALAAYPVGVERGFISRAAAEERTLATLRFFWSSPHGSEPDATGYQGLYGIRALSRSHAHRGARGSNGRDREE